MLFIEGTQVRYKDSLGIISFCSSTYVSILIKEGGHKSQNVNIVVYAEDFANIHEVDVK